MKALQPKLAQITLTKLRKCKYQLLTDGTISGMAK
jgi:hypothetical protein